MNAVPYQNIQHCTPLEVISDDVDDPVAFSRLCQELQKAHDAQGPERHPGTRGMEMYLRTHVYFPRIRPLVEWFRQQCIHCQEKVWGCVVAFTLTINPHRHLQQSCNEDQ